MENKSSSSDMVPYIVYEGEMTRNERHIKRLIFALIMSVLLLAASNGMWLYAWMQYDYESDSITTTQDGKGVNINSIGSGSVDYVPEDSSQK